jgi:hypothetical protein
MDTNELIRALAADTRPTKSLSAVWWGATVGAIALAGAVFLATLGPRPDLMAALETPRFLFKFVVTITFAASAFGLARALSRPGERWRRVLPYLAAASALIVLAVIVELIVLPPDIWAATMIGRNSMVCLAYIPATFYALQCTDDSPLFVATWYMIAITGLALIGAGIAHRFVRW